MADRPMPSSFDENTEYHETGYRKILRKLREEPLVPLGTGLTCLALWNAFRAMRRGDSAGVQRMFRARVGAQAFTVIAMVAGGAYYGADREKRRELIKLEAQKRAEERSQRWLHELEVRDEEEKKLQAAVKRKRDRLEQKRAEEQKNSDKEPKIATASPTPAATAADSATVPTEVKGAEAPSQANGSWGWFGAKKETAEESKPEKEAPKGPAVEVKQDKEAPKKPTVEIKTDKEAPKK